MAYRLTPYDRRVRAELIRQERETKFAARNPTYKKTGATTVAPADNEKESNGFLRVLQTGLDLNSNLAGGVLQSAEGLVDLLATGVGAIGGIFSDDFRDDVKDFVATDYTDKLFMQNVDKLTEGSYLNEGRAGEIIEGVAQGVGQMLPDVLISIATMGAYSGVAGAKAAATAGTAAAKTAAKAAAKTAAKQAAIKAGQRAAMVSLAAHATGSGIQEAFADGASYGEGALYGAVTGATELATEKLTGGMGRLYGKGISAVAKSGAKTVGKEIAGVGAKRVLKEMAGEGVEEMLSEATNPLRKAIYKGKDAIAEYGEGDFWAGVGEAGIIGAGTSVAYGGTVGKLTRTGGIYADANNVAEHITEQGKKLARMDADGTLTPEAEVQIAENIKADYELLSKRLQKASGKTRANVLKNPQFAQAFESDGTLKADFAAQLDTNIKAAGDTSGELDRRYYSATARGREAQIIEGLAAQGTKVVSGELTTKESASYKKAKQIHNKLRSLGFVNTDLVLAETMPDANAYLDGKTVVIGRDSLADGSYVKHLVHETTHFTEGTQEWLDVMDHVFGKDGSAVSDLIERVKASGYGVTQADADAVLKAVRDGKLKDTALTERQRTLVTEVIAMQMEETFGNEDAINRLVREKPSLAKRIFERIKAFLQTFGKATDKDPEAIAKLRRTEKLFRRALENAGVKYAVDEARADKEGRQEATESTKKEKAPDGGEVQRSFRGYAEDGKGIYEANFPKGTPKAAKSERILSYIRDVWSKEPIRLVISNGETSRTILAEFDPAVDESQNTPTDASKLAGGNRHGNHTEQRVTLDLADDYYKIASEAEYNYSKLETGKDLKTHNDVNMWHYFVNDIYFAEQGVSELTPYTVTINVKEKADGDFVYSFNAEKEPSTRRTLHAGVNTRKGANGELFLNNSITQNAEKSTSKAGEISDKIRQSRKVQYSMAGKTARIADQHKLATAKQMLREGLSSETVRKATGWFRGYDGKWRFEIDDSGMEFSREGYYAGERERLRKEYDAFKLRVMMKQLRRPYTDADADKARLAELQERLENARSDLDQHVKHDALFAAYPELRRVKLRLEPGAETGYLSAEKEISIDSNLSDEEIKHSLIHEIQHAIQDIEGFARGASTSYWLREMGSESPEEYDIAVDEMVRAFYRLRDGSSAEVMEKLLLFQLLDTANDPRYWHRTRALALTLLKNDPKGLFSDYYDALRKKQALDAKYGERHPYEMYQRTAGEVEARDVAARQTMSARQRWEARPDIDRTDVLFADRESALFGERSTGFDRYLTPDGVEYERINEIRYSRKRQDSLINGTFPPYNKSGSEANQLATRWAHREDVETGAQALLSYHNRWYLIQKFDSMDLGYLIMKRVKIADYEWYKKEIKHDGEKNDTRIEILDEIAERFESRNFNDGTKSGSNGDVTGHRQQDSDVLRLATEQGGQKSEFDGQRNSDYERGGANQQGREAEIKLSRKSANRNHDKVYTKSDARKVLSDEGEVKYSYDFLVKKPDMVIKDVVLASSQEAAQYRDDTVKFGADMRKNAAQKNNPKNTETETYLFCKDLETDVLITKNSFKHGGARLDATYVTICKNVDAVLENSIVVNELSARDDTDGGYVLLGMVETPNDFVVVRSVVNKRSHRLMEFQQLDAIKKQEITKIEDVGLRPPDYPQKRGSATSSTISIAGLLDFVKNKNLANEVFSADVAQRLGVGRTKGSLSNDLKFSRKADNGVIPYSQIIPAEEHEYHDLTDASDVTENHEAAGYLPGGAKIHEHKASPSTRFTHRDINEMLENIRRESLTFTLEDGTEINGKISRHDGWDLDKWLYDTLNTANLKDKRVLAARIADQILATAVTESNQPLRDAVSEDGTTLVREDLTLSVAALLGDKQAQIENRRINAHFDTMRKIVTEMEDVEKGRFYSATIYDGNTLRAIPNMIRAALKTSRAFTGSIRNTLAKVKDWYCAEDNAMMYKPIPGEHNEGMTDGQIVFDKDIAAMLEQLTTGTGKLSVQELEMVVDIAKHFQKLSERYQRVFFDGKWVDAEPVAEEFVKVMQTARKDQNWIVRGLLNKYMRQFGDPAALFRAMDAYDPNGFYTKMHEWMRNAAISMQSDELHALREYYEWHEKHKKWAKHLENDIVEFRGEQMTLGQLMTLYCNAKTEKSKQALADNGYKFTDKDGGVHRLKGIIYHQKGNSSVKHTREEVQRACKGVETDIWDMLTEEQRQYVKLLENVLNTTCRKWKIDTDTLMKGFSRVHERGYYFPTAHNGIAKTVDTTFYEGDRVGHLSLNKDVVEGARGELLIENIDDVVLRHVHNMSLYKNYAIVAENRSMLQNIDVGEVDATSKRVKNVHQAVTIRTVDEEFNKNLGKNRDEDRRSDIMKLLDKMSNDLQGGRRAGQDEQSFLKDLVEKIRGNYARYQLAINPKTLATQLSSLIAAGNILDYNCIVRGIKGFGSKKTAQLVDKYCPLAELRNFDNSAALAAGVLETTGKVGDMLMKGIGFVDRRVICSLFYACQLQVQKDGKLALGTEENLKAAGELLTRVILETQQNSLVTEKSDAMRGGIFSRTFTMFTADGMKVIGRWFDAIGEWAVLHKRYKDAKTDADKVRLKKELKRAHGQAIRSTSALAAQAVYMALISYAFRLLYDKDEDEVGENVLQGVWDFVGGLIGGLPVARDIYSYFTEGYELDNFFLSTINDVLVATSDAVGVASDAISGKDISRQDVAGAVRKVVYSAGQVLGIPTRNAYNFVTGLTRRIVPTAGYTVDSLFTQKAYTSDLEKAIEAEDEHMIETIAGLMIDEKIGIEDETTRSTLKGLTEKGHSVLPRSVGDTVTLNGETVTLTGAQQKRFHTVYAVGEEAVADMVKLKQFQSAGAEVQAKAISFVYDVYWDLALEDALGLDLAEKNVLFAEAIDIEKLAVIIATARAIEADKDKDGKAISGTRKRKVQTFVNSLRLSAAEKYMVMGYLGYSNANGEGQVKSYISGLNLSKSEKEALLKYSGYGA